MDPLVLAFGVLLIFLDRLLVLEMLLVLALGLMLLWFSFYLSSPTVVFQLFFLLSYFRLSIFS